MNWNDAETAIEAVYEAALRPETWPDALAGIAGACRSNVAFGQMVGANGYNVAISRGIEYLLPEYMAGGWHELNPRMERGLALTWRGHVGLITEQDMMTKEELATHPFQQEFASRYQIEHEAGRLVASHQGSHFILTIQRGLKSGPHEGMELEAMNRLVDRFSDACSFALRMKLTAAADMMETLGARGEALALLAPRGRILSATAAFERLLSGGFVSRSGGVHAFDCGEDRELQALILRAASWTPEASEPLVPVILGRGSGRPLVARCLPVAGAARDFLGLARIVLAIDEVRPSDQVGTAAALRAAFGLTPSEARLAERIGRGESLREIASAEEITYETARTRLKTVFRKTDTSRQSELTLLADRLS